MKTELNWDLSNQNFCLWDWNLETGSIALSPNWLEILGLDLSDYSPTSSWFNGLVHPEDRDLLLIHLEKQLAGMAEDAEGFTFRMKKDPQTYVQFKDRGMIVLQNPQGQPGHVIWAVEFKELVALS